MIKKLAASLLCLLLACSLFLPSMLATEAGSGEPDPSAPTAVSVAAQELNLDVGDEDAAYRLNCVSSSTGTGNAHTATNEDYYINLRTEKLYSKTGLPAEMQSVYISTNGGSKWKPITAAPETPDGEGGTDISKLLNKGGNIKIATDITDKQPTKGSAADTDEDGNEIAAVTGANVYDLGNYTKRPKAPKAKIDYLKYADKTGSTNGYWTLDISTAGLEIAPTVNNKTSSIDAFLVFKTGTGVTIFDCDTKVVKSTYLIRTAPNPVTRTPASKVKKVKVSSTLKPTKFKVDYKNEIIKTKVNAIYVEGTIDEEDDEKTTYIWDNQADLTPATKASAKTGIPLVQTKFEYVKNGNPINEESYYGKTLMVRISATNKKPASAIQTITVGERTPIYEADVNPSVNNGAFKVPTGMEYYREDTKKWATGSIKKPGTYLMRFRNKGKYNVKTDGTSGNVGGLPLQIELINGKYGTNDSKEGVVDFKVIDFPRYPGLIVGRVLAGSADAGKDIHNYSIYPKDFFDPNLSDFTVTVELHGLLSGSSFLDINEDAIDIGLHPDLTADENDTMATGAYINAELKTSANYNDTDTKPLEIKSATLNDRTITFKIGKPAIGAAQATGGGEGTESTALNFPSDGTTFTLKLSLHEPGEEDPDKPNLTLRDKFVCRDVTFTYKLPTYELKLAVSSKLSYSFRYGSPIGISKPLIQGFDWTQDSFAELDLTKVVIPQLIVDNQVIGAWGDITNTITMPSGSADTFVVANSTGSNLEIVSGGLRSDLKFYTQPAKTTEGALIPGEVRNYFFVLCQADGNYYPYELVARRQDDVVVSTSSATISANLPDNNYNKVTLTLTAGTFDAAEGIKTSNYTIKQAATNTTSTTSEDIEIYKAVLSNDNKTVTLYLNEVMKLTTDKKRVTATINGVTFASGIVVRNTNVGITPGQEANPAVTITSATKSSNNTTATIVLSLVGNSAYSFKEINTAVMNDSLAYFSIANINLTGAEIITSNNNATMTIKLAGTIPSSITLTLKTIAFTPVLCNDMVLDSRDLATQ